jgi:hypothetical protein
VSPFAGRRCAVADIVESVATNCWPSAGVLSLQHFEADVNCPNVSYPHGRTSPLHCIGVETDGGVMGLPGGGRGQPMKGVFPGGFFVQALAVDADGTMRVPRS